MRRWLKRTRTPRRHTSNWLVPVLVGVCDLRTPEEQVFGTLSVRGRMMGRMGGLLPGRHASPSRHSVMKPINRFVGLRETKPVLPALDAPAATAVSRPQQSKALVIAGFDQHPSPCRRDHVKADHLIAAIEYGL